MNPPRKYMHCETDSYPETSSPRKGSVSISMRVDSLSDQEVRQQLAELANCDTQRLSMHNARSFLIHLLRTAAKPTDTRFERAMSPSKRAAPRSQSTTRAKPRSAPQTMDAVTTRVLQRCKAAGMGGTYFWRQMDADLSNSVTIGELEQGLHKLRLQLLPSELSALFRWSVPGGPD